MDKTIVERIIDKVEAFYEQFCITPCTLFIGQAEYIQLVKEHALPLTFDVNGLQRYLSMRVLLVNAYSYLEVGAYDRLRTRWQD